MSYHLKQVCKDYQNIENYEKALADNFVGWECPDGFIPGRLKWA